LMSGKHECVVFDLNVENVKALASEGAKGTSSLEEFVRSLQAPRAAWVMVPPGPATEATVMSLPDKMEPADIIIHGGNSHFKDSVRRANRLKERGIHYVDVGTSGGVWGRQRGYCLMVGGEATVFHFLEPLFQTLAPGRGEIARTPGRQTSVSSAELGY